MIELHFRGVQPQHNVVVGPAKWFRVGGNFMRQGPDGRIVARYRNHLWEVGDRFFTSYQCRNAIVQFEEVHGARSEPFGPYEVVNVADGGARTGDGMPFAKFIEETVLWRCDPTDTYWPTMVLRSADEPDQPDESGKPAAADGP